MSALIDTGFLLAVLDADDQLHAACREAILFEPSPILPDVVLSELAYLVVRDLGYPPLTTFLKAIAQGELHVAHFQNEDISRAAEILTTYADNRVDFVDCMIVAMAERLDIQSILTIDRRHFGAFKPKHCNHFQIIPEQE